MELDKSLEDSGTAFIDVITTTPLTIPSSSSSSSAWGLHGEPSKDGAEEKGKKARVYLGNLFVKVFVPFVRRALVEGVYGFEGEEMEKDWKSDLEFSRTWEDWLQRSAP